MRRGMQSNLHMGLRVIDLIGMELQPNSLRSGQAQFASDDFSDMYMYATSDELVAVARHLLDLADQLAVAEEAAEVSA